MQDKYNECEFYKEGWCCQGDTSVPKEVGYADILCTDECNASCYYKQLQAKTQEYETLGNKICDYETEIAYMESWENQENIALLKQVGELIEALSVLNEQQTLLYSDYLTSQSKLTTANEGFEKIAGMVCERDCDETDDCEYCPQFYPNLAQEYKKKLEDK